MTRGRQRKKKRQQALALAKKEAAAKAQRAGQGPLTVLADPGHVRDDIGLVEQALSHNWPVTPQRKEAVVARLCGIVEKSGSDLADSLAIRAASVLVTADRSNVSRENGPRSGPSTTVNVVNSANATSESVTVQSLLDGMTNDPGYLDYLRDCAAGRDSGPLGENGQRRTVEAGATPAMAGRQADAVPAPIA